MAGLHVPEQEVKGSQLRALLFGAEQCEKKADWRKAQDLYLQLQCFLEGESLTGDNSEAYTRPLRAKVETKLQQLLFHPELLQVETAVANQALDMAGCSEDFQFDISKECNLVEQMRGMEPYQTLLAFQPPPPPRTQPNSKHPGPSSSRPPLSNRDNSAGSRPPARLHPPHTASQPATAAPPTCSRPPGASVAADTPTPSGIAQHHQKGNPHPPLAPPNPWQQHSRQQQQQQQHMMPTMWPRPAAAEAPPQPPQDRKRDASGNIKGGADASTQRWQPTNRGMEAGPMKALTSAELLDGSDDSEGEPAAQQGPPEAFQTARASLAADMRKKGLPARFSAQSDSSGSGGGGGGSGRSGTGGSRGGSLPPRAAPGRGGAGARGNVRGGFIPPFARKALAAGGGDGEEGPLSAATLEKLAGPDGQLPEALQKMDPNIVELVCNEIMESGEKVQWEDIAGQEAAKRLLQELVVWPMQAPHIFTGARAPPKGLLLFGPPGTGKTLIGRAIASNIRATFFSISAGSLTSKWIGDGEKMVRALFAVARCMAPAVIFIDEVDSILSARKAEGEHEASRRLKTQMLVEMEGCSTSDAACRVLLVGATNRPEELDEAARRRMPKQLHIPLPCPAARLQMLQRALGDGSAIRTSLSEGDIGKIVAKTDGYSGSDMKHLIQEACQGPVRDAVAAHGAAVASLCETDLRPIILRDFAMAAKAQRATVEAGDLRRYEEYDARHGARYADPGGSSATADEDDGW